MGCEELTKEKKRESDRSPEVADNLLATGEEGARHFIALRIPDSGRLALRGFHAGGMRSGARVTGASLEFVHRAAAGSSLGELDQGATTHVALHDSLKHLVTTNIVGLGGSLLRGVFASRRSSIGGEVSR
jgi:hypothetical protein